MARFLFIGFIFLTSTELFKFALGSEVVFLQTQGTTRQSTPQPVPGTLSFPGGDEGNNPFVREINRRRSQEAQPGRPGTQPAPQTAPVTAQPTAPQTAPPTAPPPTAPPAAAGAARSGSTSSGPGVTFRFANAPIDTVISNIMGELGYSYVIDPRVTGTVNLFTMREVPRNKLFEVLEQVLKMNGQGIVKQDGIYVISPLSDGPRQPHGVLVKPQPKKAPEKGKKEDQETKAPATGAPATDQQPGSATTVPPSGLADEQGVVTYVIPLHYLSSEHMKQMAQVYASEGANVVDFAPANILIITDHRKNIQQILDLVDLLDTNYFSINNVDLIPIKNNLAKDVAEDLGKVFAPGEKSSIRLVAIERLNSILVVTHGPSVLQEVKNWIENLDSPSASTNIKTFVYQVENNTAMNIADVLAQLYQDGMGLPSSATGEVREGQLGNNQAPGQRTQPGFLPESFNQGINRGGQSGIRSELGPSLQGRPMMTQQGVKAVVAGNVKVIVNEYNNSLIVQATQTDYEFLLETIKQLDVLPRQVLIEAKIYSVELRDELSFGVAAFLKKLEATGPATTGSISAPASGSPGGALTLATRAVIGLERQLDATLNALRSKTNVEIMEAPQLLAMDGMQATFNVGAEVPVTTASFGNPIQSGTSTAFVNSINFRPTGTTLLIVPRISASGIVTMDLAIEVSSATGAALTPTINRNYVETSLIVKDGQTVAIAGIISDTYNLTRNRVPLVGDIPVLGALFGQTSRDKRRAELIFLITPHVVPTLPSAAELTVEFKRSLRNAYSFIKRKQAEQKELIEERRLEELREIREEQEREQERQRKLEEKQRNELEKQQQQQQPPAEQPPAEQPPAEQPPAEQPPAQNPPAENPTTPKP